MPLFANLRKAVAGVFAAPNLNEMPTTFKPSETLGATTSGIAYDSAYTREKNPALRTPHLRFNEFSNVVANNIIAAIGVRMFHDLLAAATWTAKPQEKAPAGAQKVADLVTSNILKPTRGTWADAVAYQGGDRHYDHRLQEWTADRRADGSIGLSSIDPRPNQTIARWEKDTNGNVLGIYQIKPGTGDQVPIPRSKLVYSADQTLTTDVEGQGILRNAYETHQRMKRLLELQGIGAESQLAGFMIGWAPLAEIRADPKIQGMPQAEADAAVAAKVKHVTDVIQNHTVNPSRGAVLDSQPVFDKQGQATSFKRWGLEVIRGDAAGQAEVHQAIERDAFWLAVLFSIEHLLMGNTRHGSFAAAQEKNGRLIDLVNSALRELAVVFRRDVIIPILALNGITDPMLVPDLVPSDIQQLDVDKASTVLLRLAQAGEQIGAPTTDKAADVMRARMGLPPREKPDPAAAALPKKPKTPEDAIDKPKPAQPEPDETPAAKRRRLAAAAAA